MPVKPASSGSGLPASILGYPVEAKPEKTPGKELGAVAQYSGGLGGWSGFIDEQEHVPELSWPGSITAYHRMRSDSQVEALHTGTVAPVREMRWAIEPNKAPSKLVEQAAADLGLPIRGQEDDAIKRGPNDFDFDQFLTDALLGMIFGHFHFEICKNDDEPDWRMGQLSPRHPRTIMEFKRDEAGKLLGIRQNISGVRDVFGMPPPIPVQKLVSFVWRPEAGSLVGRSMLRSIYREWLVKDRAIRIAAINLERAGGVPVVIGAQGASDDQLKDLAEMARQFKVAEGGGGSLPFGSKLELAGGSVPDAIGLLKYCDECMARVWALMLVQLGMTQTGNRALGSEFAIYAARAQRAIAKWFATTVNKFLDNYTTWNDATTDYAPLLVYEQAKPDGMSVTDLVSLIDAKALTVDPELEDWLRCEHGLPDKPTEDEWQAGLSPDEVALVKQARDPAFPTPAANSATNGATPQDQRSIKPSPSLDSTSTEPTLAKGGPTSIERVHRGIRASLTLPDRKMRRLPSENEIRAAVDFKGLDTAHGEALAKLQEGWLREILPKQIGAMARQVEVKADGAPRQRFTRAMAAQLQAPEMGHDLLVEHLKTVMENGAYQAGRELHAQGVPRAASYEAFGRDARALHIADHAEAVVKLNANAVALAAQRKAAQLIGGGRNPQQIASELKTHLEGMKHVWEREQLRGAVTMAQNQGRIAVMEAAQPDQPDAVYEASELLDENTCQACAGIDGKVYDSLEEAEEDYATGGYIDCEGGPNCRGTLVGVYPEQNPMGGEGELREAEPPLDQPTPGGEAAEPVPGTPEIPGIEPIVPTPGEVAPVARELAPDEMVGVERQVALMLRNPGNPWQDVMIDRPKRLIDKFREKGGADNVRRAEKWERALRINEEAMRRLAEGITSPDQEAIVQQKLVELRADEAKFREWLAMAQANAREYERRGEGWANEAREWRRAAQAGEEAFRREGLEVPLDPGRTSAVFERAVQERVSEWSDKPVAERERLMQKARERQGLGGRQAEFWKRELAIREEALRRLNTPSRLAEQERVAREARQAEERRLAPFEHAVKRLEEPGGGMTIDEATGKEVKEGFAVGGLGGEESHDANAFFTDRKTAAEAIANFVERNAEGLGEPGVHLGLWHDPKEGKIWIEKAEVISNKRFPERRHEHLFGLHGEEKAIALGVERGERAIYDLSNGREIDLRVYREAGPQGAVGPRPGLGTPRDSGEMFSTEKEASFEDAFANGPIGGEAANESAGVSESYMARVGEDKIILKPESGASGGRDTGANHYTVLNERYSARERGVYLVGQRMGIPVPTTVVRDTPHGEASIMRIVPKAREISALSHSEWDAQDVHDLALLDAVTANLDRHGGNAMIVRLTEAEKATGRLTMGGGPSEFRLIPIDHNISFPDEPGSEWANAQFLGRVQGNPITDEDVAKLNNVLAHRDELITDAGLHEDQVALMEGRIKEMLDTRQFPYAETRGEGIRFADKPSKPLIAPAAELPVTPVTGEPEPPPLRREGQLTLKPPQEVLDREAAERERLAQLQREQDVIVEKRRNLGEYPQAQDADRWARELAVLEGHGDPAYAHARAIADKAAAESRHPSIKVQKLGVTTQRALREADVLLREGPLTLDQARAVLDNAAATPSERDRAEAVLKFRAKPAGEQMLIQPGEQFLERGVDLKQRILNYVRANPGQNIPEIARALGLRQNVMYRHLPVLQNEGLVEKRGRAWHALDAQPRPVSELPESERLARQAIREGVPNRLPEEVEQAERRLGLLGVPAKAEQLEGGEWTTVGNWRIGRAREAQPEGTWWIREKEGIAPAKWFANAREAVAELPSVEPLNERAWIAERDRLEAAKRDAEREMHRHEPGSPGNTAAERKFDQASAALQRHLDQAPEPHTWVDWRKAGMTRTEAQAIIDAEGGSYPPLAIERARAVLNGAVAEAMPARGLAERAADREVVERAAKLAVIPGEAREAAQRLLAEPEHFGEPILSEARRVVRELDERGGVPVVHGFEPGTEAGLRREAEDAQARLEQARRLGAPAEDVARYRQQQAAAELALHQHRYPAEPRGLQHFPDERTMRPSEAHGILEKAGRFDDETLRRARLVLDDEKAAQAKELENIERQALAFEADAHEAEREGEGELQEARERRAEALWRMKRAKEAEFAHEPAPQYRTAPIPPRVERAQAVLAEPGQAEPLALAEARDVVVEWERESNIVERLDVAKVVIPPEWGRLEQEAAEGNVAAIEREQERLAKVVEDVKAGVIPAEHFAKLVELLAIARRLS